MATRRRRGASSTPRDEVRTALQAGQKLDWSPERHEALIELMYFLWRDSAMTDHLTAVEESNGLRLMDAWDKQQREYERESRVSAGKP